MRQRMRCTGGPVTRYQSLEASSPYLKTLGQNAASKALKDDAIAMLDLMAFKETCACLRGRRLLKQSRRQI